MSSSVVVPTRDNIANYPPAMADALIAVATQAQTDLNSLLGGSSGSFRARAVCTSLGANTGTTTGTLTVTATGALGAQDGVTLVAGDVLLVPEGTTNLSAASDAGPYVVTSAGGTGVHAVLSRPTWWATGQPIVPADTVEVGGEGTTYAGTAWKTFVAKGKVIDTDAPLLWPREITQDIQLSSGIKAVTNVPIRDASASAIFANLKSTSGTTATTVMYTPTLVTAGALNTATVTFAAQSVPGTNQTSDASHLRATVINW